jgi:transcriptional regulator with XRE-family HTH domain
MSQAELAEAADVSTKLVSAIEQCNRSPSLETLEKLCRALGVTPTQLLEAGASATRGPRSHAEEIASMFMGLDDTQCERMLAVLRGVRELVEPDVTQMRRTGAARSRARKGAKK